MGSAEFAGSAHVIIRSVSGDGSCLRYLIMIFLKSGAKAGTEKNASGVERRALATISSEGGIAGFMVRSQLRKQCQTCAV